MKSVVAAFQLSTDQKRFLSLLTALFAIFAIAFRGMTGYVDVTGTMDELTCHYPTALYFAENPVAFALRDYHSATGPLVYLLALAMKPVGMSLVAIRWLTFLSTFLLIWRAYLFLTDLGGLNPSVAGALSLAIALCPVVLGSTVVFMTDNYGWLFTLLALHQIMVYARGGALRSFLFGAIFLGLAAFTRQTTVWLLFPALYALWLRKEHWIHGLLALAISLIPLAYCVLLWKHLTPPQFAIHHEAVSGITFKSWTMGTLLLGFYGLLLLPMGFGKELREWIEQEKWLAIVGGLAGLSFFLLAPLAGDHPGEMRNKYVIDGYLMKLVEIGPHYHVYYPLYGPLCAFGGLLFIFALRRRDPWISLVLGSMFTVYMANHAVYQRYDDFVVLIFLGLLFKEAWNAGRLNRLTFAILLALFIVHPFYRHWKTPTPIHEADRKQYTEAQAKEIEERFIRD